LKDLKKARESALVFDRYFGSQSSHIYAIDVQDGQLIERKITSNDDHLDVVLFGDQPQIRIFIIPPGETNGTSSYLLNTNDAKKLFTRYNVRPTFLHRICSAQNLEFEIERNYESKDTTCSEIDKFGRQSYALRVKGAANT
jgi:hypothetical protein